jgi:cysteine desulfurase
MELTRTIYLDYQSTTRADPRVVEEMAPYMSDLFGNPHSSDHSAGWRAAEAVDGAKRQVASTIGCDPDEVIFTSGATESNNLALLGFARRAVGQGRQRILVSAIEHKSVLAAARALRDQLGYVVEQLPVDRVGHLRFEEVERSIGDDVLLVSVMAVNNEIGTIQDVAAISRIARRFDVKIHTDATQAVGNLDARTLTEHVDFLSLSGHKIYGPKGIGALFVRRDMQERVEPLIYGGGQQGHLRSGTLPVPLCVGLGVAAVLSAGAEHAEKRDTMRERRDRFVRMMCSLPWNIVVNGPDGGSRHPGNANLRFDGFSAHEILGSLQPRVAASTGSACTSGMPEPSHVLRAIGLSRDEAESSIRFSLGLQTSDEELDEVVSLVDEVLPRLRPLGN